MYALTREGRKPPMVAVRQSIYSLLERRNRKPYAVNMLGQFAPFDDDCELYDLLRQAGIREINEISRLADYEAYLDMASANFNLVLNPESRLAAQDLEKRLEIPSVELTRMYQIDKIANQYMGFASVIGAAFHDTDYRKQAEDAVEAFTASYPGTTLAIGEMLNANSFELALAMSRYGLKVAEIYGNPTTDDLVYIRNLAKISPDTKIFANLSPTMLYYDSSEAQLDLTIGKDARYYHPGCPNVSWSSERQPFGYEGVRKLFTEMRQALDNAGKER